MVGLLRCPGGRPGHCSRDRVPFGKGGTPGSRARHVLTILAVSDLERARRFYESAFDGKLRVDVPVFARYEGPGAAGVALCQREAFGVNTGEVPAPAPAGSIAGTELCFFTEDLPAAIERIRAAGGRLLTDAEKKPWGDTAAYFADPDGNVIAVAKEE